MFDKLDSKEEQNDIHRMTKRKQEKTNDFGVVKCIKDNDENILVHNENIKD